MVSFRVCPAQPTRLDVVARLQLTWQASLKATKPSWSGCLISCVLLAGLYVPDHRQCQVSTLLWVARKSHPGAPAVVKAVLYSNSDTNKAFECERGASQAEGYARPLRQLYKLPIHIFFEASFLGLSGSLMSHGVSDRYTRNRRTFGMSTSEAEHLSILQISQGQVCGLPSCPFVCIRH